MSDPQIKSIFVIVDTNDMTFWKSANEKTSWPSVGTAKTAFASSNKNPTGKKYREQTRFRVARLELLDTLFAVKYM